MCGIVGITGKSQVSSRLLNALKRLEYRGYDSAGMATLEGGKLVRRRVVGKLANLERLLNDRPLLGNTGIGHTRWATHGTPSENNAHPHQTDRLAIVHNGIIENFNGLRQQLAGEGCIFKTETDTETIAHLVTRYMEKGFDARQAVRLTLEQLKGAFAFAILFESEDNLIVGARRGAPLAIGYGEGEMYLGSDAFALSLFTDRIVYLEDGDQAMITSDEAEIFNDSGVSVERRIEHLTPASFVVDKGNYRHFMLKEIHEQPEVISHVFSRYLDFINGTIKPVSELSFDFSSFDRITISACGTAYLAGLVARYWFEYYARIQVDIDVASEFRYRNPPLERGGLSLFISQSGETADTLSALRYCKRYGHLTGAIVNVGGSSMTREAGFTLPTLAGQEIGVASTKAFTSQLSVLACLAIMAGRARDTLNREEERKIVNELGEASRFAGLTLKLERQIEEIARTLAKADHALYLGRGISYPLALEGALKLKEVSYIHAEGYAAGELKHGPIALIDENMPVIVIAPSCNEVFKKTVSNMQEVAARGGRIILITDESGAKNSTIDTEHILVMPDMPEILVPLVYSIPIQMLAYYAAVTIGTDIDQPRNLAKSVTVE